MIFSNNKMSVYISKLLLMEKMLFKQGQREVNIIWTMQKFTFLKERVLGLLPTSGETRVTFIFIHQRRNLVSLLTYSNNGIGWLFFYFFHQRNQSVRECHPAFSITEKKRCTLMPSSNGRNWCHYNSHYIILGFIDKHML